MEFGPYLFIASLEGAITAAVLALTAVGLSIVFGIMRVVNVAHGEFFMLGAVIAWWITSMITAHPALGFVAALIVDREKLTEYQTGNDALMCSNTLKKAFTTDVSPILEMARLRKGGAIDPIAVYRKSGYRKQAGVERPNSGGNGSGIV